MVDDPDPKGHQFEGMLRKPGMGKHAEKYDEFAGKVAKFGLVKEDRANLENYVTAKALDGLYLR